MFAELYEKFQLILLHIPLRTKSVFGGYMALRGGKKELEEIKTGIGGKTVKRFSSVGGWK